MIVEAAEFEILDSVMKGMVEEVTGHQGPDNGKELEISERRAVKREHEEDEGIVEKQNRRERVCEFFS